MISLLELREQYKDFHNQYKRPPKVLVKGMFYDMHGNILIIGDYTYCSYFDNSRLVVKIDDTLTNVQPTRTNNRFDVAFL